MFRFTINAGSNGSQFPWRNAVLAAGLLAWPATGRADVITDVNNALLNIIQNTSAALVDGPPEVAREIAMVNGAMFDAVNAASGSPFAALAYRGGAVPGASASAAALSAAIAVMHDLYESPTSIYQTYRGVTGAAFYGASSPYAGTAVGPSISQMAIVASDISSLMAELSALGSAAAVTNGSSLGTAAGNAMVIARAADGSVAANLSSLTPYVPVGSGTVAGVYVPPTARPALDPAGGTVLPFGLTSATLSALVNAVPPVPVITTQAYALQILQTECQGAGSALPANIASVCHAAGFAPETTAEATAALFWNDPGSTYQPPGHWLQIADTVADARILTLLQHARLDSLVGAAMSDAGSAVWAIKFRDNLWRPITAIRDCNAWNTFFTTCDAAWTSLIGTPPHPDYLAGHPGFSGAAATVLANFFGTDSIPFSSTSQPYCNAGAASRDATGNVIACTLNGQTYAASNLDRFGCNNAATQPIMNPDFTANPLYNASPLICPITETFAGFSDASSGALGSTFSRVAGGIHTPISVENAVALGNAIGQEIAVANGIGEPGTTALLVTSLAAFAAVRRRRPALCTKPE